MIYLAAPYTHTDKDVIQQRIKIFTDVDSSLSALGLITVSPLFKHLLFLNNSKLPSDWAYWENYSYKLLERCDALFVIKIAGWETSIGVQHEIKFATEKEIPVLFLEPL